MANTPSVASDLLSSTGLTAAISAGGALGLFLCWNQVQKLISRSKLDLVKDRVDTEYVPLMLDEVKSLRTTVEKLQENRALDLADKGKLQMEIEFLKKELATAHEFNSELKVQIQTNSREFFRLQRQSFTGFNDE